MISAKELREFSSSRARTGFTIEEVNKTINSAADTIEARENENKNLYHKLEVLAKKIEDYRSEEDSIKTALITAQKMADRIKTDSSNEADRVLTDSRKKADDVLKAAKAQAEKVINEAREYSNSLINQKKQEADSIIIDAEKKSNDAINSSQTVAQNILDQAKEISNELIKKSQEEKEAYEQLNSTLARNAAEFIDSLKKLYGGQLDALNSAKVFSTDGSEEEENLKAVKNDADSLLSEIEDMKRSIPKEVKIEKHLQAENREPQNTQPVKESEPLKAGQPQNSAEDKKSDTMDAVNAFSTDEITPIDKSKPVIPEISEEAEPEESETSLFDEKLPFENYFHINNKDAHLDKTQTISLISPDEEDGGEQNSQNNGERRKKGLFKKKK